MRQDDRVAIGRPMQRLRLRRGEGWEERHWGALGGRRGAGYEIGVRGWGGDVAL